jgi:outer membrane protein OmpA-like peptidoglycan-associated protein
MLLLATAIMFQLRGTSAPIHPGNYLEMAGPRIGAADTWGVGLSASAGSYRFNEAASECRSAVGCYDYGSGGISASYRASLPISVGVVAHASARHVRALSNDLSGNGLAGVRLQAVLHEKAEHAYGLLLSVNPLPVGSRASLFAPMEWSLSSQARVALSPGVWLDGGGGSDSLSVMKLAPGLDIGASWQIERSARAVGLLQFSVSSYRSTSRQPYGTETRTVAFSSSASVGLQFGAPERSSIWFGGGATVANDVPVGIQFTTGIILRPFDMSTPRKPKEEDTMARAPCAPTGDPEIPECIGAFAHEWHPPAPAEPLARDGNELITLGEPRFARDSATLDAHAHEAIAKVAEYMQAHAEVELLEISGHADDRAADAYNLALTERRAQAVVQALQSRGIEPQRLLAVGVGKYCPKDLIEHAQNRRVEFRILKDAHIAGELGSAVCEAARRRLTTQVSAVEAASPYSH